MMPGCSGGLCVVASLVALGALKIGSGESPRRDERKPKSNGPTNGRLGLGKRGRSKGLDDGTPAQDEKQIQESKCADKQPAVGLFPAAGSWAHLCVFSGPAQSGDLEDTVENHYVINVARKTKGNPSGEFYFRVESATQDYEAAVIVKDFQRAFPKSKGFEITVTWWAGSGQEVSVKGLLKLAEENFDA